MKLETKLEFAASLLNAASAAIHEAWPTTAADRRVYLNDAEAMIERARRAIFLAQVGVEELRLKTEAKP